MRLACSGHVTRQLVICIYKHINIYKQVIGDRAVRSIGPGMDPRVSCTVIGTQDIHTIYIYTHLSDIKILIVFFFFPAVMCVYVCKHVYVTLVIYVCMYVCTCMCINHAIILNV